MGLILLSGLFSCLVGLHCGGTYLHFQILQNAGFLSAVLPNRFVIMHFPDTHDSESDLTLIKSFLNRNIENINFILSFTCLLLIDTNKV